MAKLHRRQRITERIEFVILSVTLIVIAGTASAVTAGPSVWHVSTEGDDVGGDGSRVRPFESIQMAINWASPGDTIKVALGEYVENATLTDGLTLLGGYDERFAGRDPYNSPSVIVDGSFGLSPVVSIQNVRDIMISGFGIGGSSWGVYCYNSQNVAIVQSAVAFNKVGIYVQDSQVRIAGSLIALNSGDGIFAISSSSRVILQIVNNTIDSNGFNPYEGFGDSGVELAGIDLLAEIKNNIITFSLYGIKESSEVKARVTYNDIFGNSAANYWDYETSYSITVEELNSQIGNRGNISQDPLFVNRDDLDYHLLPDSPCVDAGDPDSPFDREPEPNGGRINMGVFGNTKWATTSKVQRPDIALSDVSHNFGDVNIRRSSRWVLTISNNGNAPLSVSDIISSSPEFTVSPTSFTLAAAGSRNVVVVFQPSSVGSKTATLTIVSNDPDEGRLEVVLSGSGKVAATLVSGEVSGIWTKAQSPYIVTGDIKVPAGGSLTIEPGVEVRFGGHYTFTVNGKLEAVGTEADTILFTRRRAVEDSLWGGIIFYEADDESRMEYCRIEYSKGREWSGGGLLFENSSPTVTNSVITNNSTDGNGGGIAIINASPTIANSTISNNSAGDMGGGIYLEGSSAIITGNIVSGNSTSWIGGGVYVGVSSSPVITDNTIVSNTADGWGGGIAVDYYSYTMISENIIRNNSAAGGRGGGLAFNNSSGIVRKSIIRGNMAGDSGGGISISDSSSVEIIGNLILNNTTDYVGGGIFIGDNSFATVAGNGIVGNAAESWGGGIGMLYGSSSTISGNIITRNSASEGGGMSFYDECSGAITNNTVVYNKATESGGGIRSHASDVAVKNTILRDNTAGDGTEVYLDVSTSVITYSNVAGGQEAIVKDAESKVVYENNLDVDPLFVDPAKGDYHLQAGSPCIDAGDPNPFFNELDNSQSDMGAYGGGSLVVNFTRYDFATVGLGFSESVDFEITNLRGTDFVISDLQLSDDVNFSISESPPIKVASYQQRTITLTFSPQAIGIFSAKLTIRSDDFYGATSADILFRGEGVGRAVSGDVSGVWRKAESPYVVIGDIFVPKWKSLSIEPGVEVRFNGLYKFVVNGKLEAVGAEADTILFTRHRETENWGGIIFYKADSASRLEYCRIEYAEATGDYPRRGGGLLFEDCFPTVANSVITNNWAEDGGGGIAIINASPRITNSIISNNSADNEGGGIYVEGLSPDITNSEIVNNAARTGGGIYVRGYASSPVITDNTIVGNEVTESYDQGGGIAVADSSSPTIRGNRIADNTVAEGGSGGGISFENRCSGTVDGNIITENDADTGGGIYVSDSSPAINGNEISDNSGTGIYVVRSSSAPKISDNTISNNSGGGIRITEGSSVEIVGNTIQRNTTDGVGGGIYIGGNSSATIVGNAITGNTSTDDWGGGIGVITSSPIIIRRNLIVGNQANDGGGISFYDKCSGTLTNNTIVDNNASGAGGGIRSEASKLTVKNTILGKEVYLGGGSTFRITYSNVIGGEEAIVRESENDTVIYENNIDANPLFVDPAGGDYHLQAGSPCIDAGDPESPPDPDGTRADIGALYFDQRAVPARPNIVLSADLYDFGDVETGYSRDWILVVSNTGTADLSVTDISSDSPDFTVSPEAFVVVPGGVQDVTVTFSPSSAGIRTGTLEVASDDPDEGVVQITLSGSGVTPDIGLSSFEHDFGDVRVGSSVDWELVVLNTGQVDLSVTDISSDSPEFLVSTETLTLAPGGTQGITLSFVPSSSGSKVGVLTITSDDPDEGSLQVSLTGNGVEQDILLRALEYDFGDVEVASTLEWELVISNQGNIPLSVEDVTSDSPDFTVVSLGFPQTIPPGGEIEVSVSFSPSSIGGIEGRLTVRSDDPDEGSVEVSLSGGGVDTTPPQIVFEAPPTSADQRSSLAVDSQLFDNLGIAEAYIFFRMGGKALYDSVRVSQVEGENYSGLIPGDRVTSRGLEYYIKVSDGTNISTSPATDASENPYVVRVNFLRLVNPTPQPGGSEQNAYRMISVPGELDDSSPASVLGDDFGTYDKTQWRLFQYIEGDGYVEFPNIGSFAPGKAFWIISRSSGIVIDTGSGRSVPTGGEFDITLDPGWNDIAVPFDFPVAWEDVRRDMAVDIDGPFGYEGEWVDPSGIALLEPWKGYAIKNLTNRSTVLGIPPREGSGVSVRPVSYFAGGDKDNWTVRILVGSQDARDRINYLGCRSGASPEWDRFDLSEPPSVGSYVSLYFPHGDWDRYPGRYTADYRPFDEGGMVWDFKVETNIVDSEVVVTFEGVDHIPSGHRVILFDISGYGSFELEEGLSYGFRSGGGVSVRDFKFVVGTEESIDEVKRGVPKAPGGFVLFQNHPNPFNLGTVVRYGIPEDSYVRVVVFDLLGREVVVLVDGFHSVGYYSVGWDGKDRLGRDVASGIYICRMDAGGVKQVRKMLLLR